MKNYLNLLDSIMTYGQERKGRNGVTKALFAQQLRWDLRQGFPIVTTKKVNFRAVVGELIWFLSGSTNDHDLRRIMDYDDDKPTIWTANEQDPKWHERRQRFGYPNGSLGRMYGEQWRHWRGCRNYVIGTDQLMTSVDQIADLVKNLRIGPNARRFIVTAWNPADLDEMALSACHVMFQCFCGVDNTLSLSMIQRSCDMFLGVPYNISSYGLLLSVLAQIVGRVPAELVITFQDAHIYEAHYEQVRTQLMRTPKPLPRLNMDSSIKEINDFKTIEQVSLDGYDPDPAIKAPMIL